MRIYYLVSTSKMSISGMRGIYQHSYGTYVIVDRINSVNWHLCHVETFLLEPKLWNIAIFKAFVVFKLNTILDIYIDYMSFRKFFRSDCSQYSSRPRWAPVNSAKYMASGCWLLISHGALRLVGVVNSTSCLVSGSYWPTRCPRKTKLPSTK